MAEQISAQSVADANVEAQKLQKKPGKRRVLTGKMGMVITVLAIGLAIFQLYTAFFGVLPTMQQRSFHVAFILPMIFLLYPALKSSPRDHATWYDILFAVLAGACSLYVFFMYEDLANRAGEFYDYEVYLGALFVTLVVILGNLLADCLYAVLDPRIKIDGGKQNG